MLREVDFLLGLTELRGPPGITREPCEGGFPTDNRLGRIGTGAPVESKLRRPSELSYLL